MGKTRTMIICLTDIPKEQIITHENGKKYLAIETWDFDKTNEQDFDFSISVSLTKEQIDIKNKGGTINRVFLGNGKIW